jgi:uncharacterized protein YjbI with pentapeptide repeats
VDQEQNPRERSFIRELVPEWRPTRKQRLWTARVTIVLIVLLGILTLIGLPFGITLWEWMKLLIVPAVIAAGGLWFNRQQRDREMEIAEQRSQDEALQAYLDQMSQLLTDKDQPLHKAQQHDSLSTVARARTLTVLRRLDGERKRRVLQFLYESDLITKNRVVVDLVGAALLRADLSWAKLSGVKLREADLRETDLGGANLNEADLSEADLDGADLRVAHLRGVNLHRANLYGADLSWAELRGANLSLANLIGANLSRSDLREADLLGANLSGADLGRAEVSEELLAQQANSLQGATMPNGQKYEDWLKDKEGSGEDGENGGPS